MQERLRIARSGTQTLRALSRSLIETDRRYFELGATRSMVTGAEIVWLDGMADLPAAGVVHRVVPAEVVDPVGWVREVTDALLDAGFVYGRIYLDEPSEPLEAQLASEGWTMRHEPGLVALVDVPSRGERIDLVPVEDPAAWAAKEDIHRADTLRPDGHEASASRWVAMERVRVDTGQVEAWLVVRGGTVCGTVCTMSAGPVFRLKNLVVHPAHRRSGVGLSVVARLDAMARVQEMVLGAFSVAGEDGDLLYRAAGMSRLVVQHEWSRPLRKTP